MSWISEMKEAIAENLFEWKETVYDWIKDRYNTKMTVQECAYRILHHPTTRKERLEYLGLVFHQYDLREEHLAYRLQTKGEHDEKILELKIIENGQAIYAYHYYQDHSAVDQTIRVPENSAINIEENSLIH